MSKVEYLLSYAILTHNEDESLQLLLNQLLEIKEMNDEIIIVDDFSDNKNTLDILEWAKSKKIQVYQHALDNDFSTQKNFLNSKCNNPYIFNVDADELLGELLSTSLKFLLEHNKEIDMFKIPRVNIVNGIKNEHVRMWGWRINKLNKFTNSKKITDKYNDSEYLLLKNHNLIITDNNDVVEYYIPIINWHDPQYRLYKNKQTIVWKNKVHEIITGYKTFTDLPTVPEYSIIHVKDIARQENQNKFYAKL